MMMHHPCALTLQHCLALLVHLLWPLLPPALLVVVTQPLHHHLPPLLLQPQRVRCPCHYHHHYHPATAQPGQGCCHPLLLAAWQADGLVQCSPVV